MRQIYVGISLTCAIIVVTWAWKVLNLVWIKPRKLEKQLKQQGLKGSSYKLLFGDIRDSFKLLNEAKKKSIPFTHDYLPRVIPFLHQHVNTYGRNSFSWMGLIPVINVTEPELIREAFTKINDFQKPKLNPLVRLIAPGLVSLEGDKWAMHRRLANPAFHKEKLKLMVPAMHDGIMELVNKWEKITNVTSSVEIDVFPYLENLSADIISRAAFGSSYEEGERMFQLLREQIDIATRLFLVGFIPGWKYVPTPTNIRMKQVNGEIQCLLKEMIEKRKTAMEAGEATKNDLLGILMESNFRETQSYGNMNKKQLSLAMSLQDVIDECKSFYFAARDTTSVLLVWTLILLSKYQDWQIRAQDEVLAIFDKDQQPHFDGLNRLKTVTMILYEVLRLYPPVISTLRTLNNGNRKLGNMTLPQGAMVDLAILQVHHDRELWGDDVKEFNPERFSEGIAKATKGNFSFFPFIAGPRVCIGQNFALCEVKLVLAVILQRFSFELSPSYTHAPTNLLSLQPQHGAHLILRRL